MSWRRRIAGALLIALAGLPVEATICARWCASTVREVPMHHAGTCDEAPRQAPGSQISGTLNHHCSTHNALSREPATASERADIIAKRLTLATAAVHIEFVSRRHHWVAVSSVAPPGAAPSTPPLVLRI